MAKWPTSPILLEECCSFTISDLIRLGYLDTDSSVDSGTLSCTRGYNVYSQANISVNIQADKPFISIEYWIGAKRIKYNVGLFSKTSNIGRGVVWFFICPVTGKRCRKLYLINNYFVHRAAFSGCIYTNQSYSHTRRRYYGQMEKLRRIEKITSCMNKPYFKHEYKGKTTKRFLKIRRLLTVEQELWETYTAFQQLISEIGEIKAKLLQLDHK